MYNVAGVELDSLEGTFHGEFKSMARKKAEESKVELKPIRLAVEPETLQRTRELAAKAGVSMTVFAKEQWTALVNKLYEKHSK